MSRKKQKNRAPVSKRADPRADASSRPAASDQPVQSDMRVLAAVVVVPASIALAIWVGKSLYAIVIEGELCRPRYGCESWSSHPVSLFVQCVGCTLLITIFVGLAYGALKALGGPESDDQA